MQLTFPLIFFSLFIKHQNIALFWFTSFAIVYFSLLQFFFFLELVTVKHSRDVHSLDDLI
jgi:hypothetical protein